MIKNKKFFDKYMKIWGEVSNIIKNKFDSIIYNTKHLKDQKIQNKRKLLMFLKTSNID